MKTGRQWNNVGWLTANNCQCVITCLLKGSIKNWYERKTFFRKTVKKKIYQYTLTEQFLKTTFSEERCELHENVKSQKIGNT